MYGVNLWNRSPTHLLNLSVGNDYKYFIASEDYKHFICIPKSKGRNFKTESYFIKFLNFLLLCQQSRSTYRYTYTRDNLEIKQVSISMKNPSNYPIKRFARLKKITTLIFKKSVALIVKLHSGSLESVLISKILEQESLAEGESTDLHIDYEKLKVKEKILFFDEVRK